MQFDTYTYALFLPLVFFIYWGLRRHLKWQNLFLLVASYVFYGWWDWKMLGLIVLTSVSTFGTALMMRGDRSRHDRSWAAANIVLNLGILAVFKYLNFMRDSFVHLLGLFGVNPDWPTLNILLPVGISFYTFQAISYTIDVYRGDVKPTRDAVAFGVFIAFFPQLVAGPIERATNLLPQFLRKKEFDYDTAVIGMRQILWGLAKKVIVADSVGYYVDQLLYNPYYYAAPSMIWAGILFAVQIYADFSGYSDIAIGSAKLLNIRLQPNFRYPFFSRNMKELWQRWHISVVPPLCVFPLGRLAARQVAHGAQRDDRVCALRSVAWCRLDFCHLGHGQRPVAVALCVPAPQAAERTRHLARVAAVPVDVLPVCHGVHRLPCQRHHPLGRNLRRDC